MNGKGVAELQDVRDEQKREQLRELLKLRTQFSAQEKEAKEMREATDASIIGIMRVIGLPKLVGQGFDGALKSFRIANSVNYSINKMKLISAGVDPETITECTDAKPYSFLDVRGASE